MVVSNFTQMNFGLLFQKWSLGTQSFCKVWDKLDTWLNNYGPISSQSIQISCISERAARIAKITIFSTPRELKNHLWGNSDDFRHSGVKFHKQMNFGLLFQKWSLGTQESFCKVSDQLDTCVNNCTCIFTRHQPRLFLKALLVLGLPLPISFKSLHAAWKLALLFLNSASFVMSNLFSVPFRCLLMECLNASSEFTLYSDPSFCLIDVEGAQECVQIIGGKILEFTAGTVSSF